MFEKASVKLTLLYLAILMAISLFFSATLYQAYLSELEHGLRRPGNVFELEILPGLSRSIRDQILAAREQQFEEAKDRILIRLLLLNMIILTGGGLVSYYLAKRTLQPIEEAHESLERFTADASHELRTPITAMKSENEVALMDPKLSLNEARLQLTSNIEELDKLTNLTEGLLRLSRLDNHKLSFEPSEAGLIVEEAIKRVTPQAEAKAIQISSQISSVKTLNADASSLTEAIVILLDNAIKYSPEKSEIKIWVGQESQFVTFVVSDIGTGIKARELPHIFDRFYRADSSRSKQETTGYGLGLAIAKSIAEAHHGKLLVKSTPGKGSCFTLKIPVLKHL